MFLTRDACPACGAHGRTLYRCAFASGPIGAFIRDYFRLELELPGEYRAVECGECGTIYQAEVGDSATIARLYGEWIWGGADDPNDEFEVAHPTLSRDGHEITAAAAFLGQRPTTLLTLDYGMGYAPWARIAKALGCRSYGVDLDPRRMEFARAHGILTGIDGVRFDFINTEQVFEHVTEPADLAADLKDRLRERGVLKISVPARGDLLRTFDRLNAGQSTVTLEEIMPLQPLEHVNCFTLEGLRRLTGMREIRPSLAQRYAFLPGISPRYPRKALKELVRPLYQWRNPKNLYVWFR